jgi:cation diffusion facilitator CzcD-associated flavoprotein CzcO
MSESSQLGADANHHATTRVDFDAVVVGAGLAGLYMLYRLRELGLSTRVYEAGDGVGGTWYWNRYPGARCDIPSLDYSYSFSPELEQEWEWSEEFPSQPEMLRYINHVADRFDLRRHINLDTAVTAITLDDGTGRWTVTTSTAQRVTARFVVMATGFLSAANIPPIPGLGDFAGQWYHTGQWPAEPVDFTGKRVGVIGTGSSGIQVIPHLAEVAASLTVFQRTPNFSFPSANRPLDPEVQAERKAGYPEYRQAARESGFGVPRPPSTRKAFEVDAEERQRIYEENWPRGGVLGSFTDLLTNPEANATAAEFVRGKIRQIVADPVVADKLCPTDHPIGTKRPCKDTGYFETFNRDNVALVDVRETPIVEFTTDGLRTTDGVHALDAVVFATGYDAMTGALSRIDIRGRDGLALKDKWAAGPCTYLGLQTAGFPNFFTITGPGSPSALSNLVVSIEQHVEWIADCVAWLDRQNLAAIEPTAAAEQAWTAHVQAAAAATLYPTANSWYLGANVPGKPRVFMPYVGGVGRYRARCSEIAQKGYEGFATR